jgi:hypothetical protein
LIVSSAEKLAALGDRADDWFGLRISIWSPGLDVPRVTSPGTFLVDAQGVRLRRVRLEDHLLEVQHDVRDVFDDVGMR